mmetsp:Transcript_15442/g.42468  ORF Transcript_15442/g.42468 Transcript_15442/m.42468 type:complete len:82 (+) Transcript_15442:606-851(+)
MPLGGGASLRSAPPAPPMRALVRPPRAHLLKQPSPARDERDRYEELKGGSHDHSGDGDAQHDGMRCATPGPQTSGVTARAP